MAPNRSSAATQPYGRACLSCSKSKCKCVPRPGGNGCERCHRLDKQCIPGDSTRALNSRRNNPIARIAQVEGKLDSLVSLLGAGRILDVPTPEERLSLSASMPGLFIPPEVMVHTPAPSGSSGSPTSVTDPSPEEAEECLTYFRNNMLKYFAFLHVPGAAHVLRQERPFLFLCIMAARSESTQTKLALGQKIKQTLAQRVIIDNDPGAINIDLLLGLLTFLAWGHDNLLYGTPSSVSRFTQLAMTLVFDLRLNKPQVDESNVLPVGSLPWNCLTSKLPARSLEERRAVLGCFVMSSIVSSYFAQMDAMQWTPYMEECLEIISQSKQSPYDEMFAHQVRLQRIVGDVETARSTTVPPVFYLAALQVKLDEVKTRISPPLQQDGILLAAVFSTELSISSLILPRQNASGTQRLEWLHACLNTVKSGLDSFFKIPWREYPGISFPFYTELARYIVVLYRLSTLDDPTWDKGLVRSSVDMLQVMDQLIGNIQLARAADDGTSVGGLLDRSTKIFMSVRSRCVAKFAEGVGGEVLDDARPHSTLIDSLPLDEEWLEDDFGYRFLEGNNFF